jgi:hypothetical protein
VRHGKADLGEAVVPASQARAGGSRIPY